MIPNWLQVSNWFAPIRLGQDDEALIVGSFLLLFTAIREDVVAERQDGDVQVFRNRQPDTRR